MNVFWSSSYLSSQNHKAWPIILSFSAIPQILAQYFEEYIFFLSWLSFSLPIPLSSYLITKLLPHLGWIPYLYVLIYLYYFIEFILICNYTFRSVINWPKCVFPFLLGCKFYRSTLPWRYNAHQSKFLVSRVRQKSILNQQMVELVLPTFQ